MRLNASKFCIAMLLATAPYAVGCSDTGDSSATPPGEEAGLDSSAAPGVDATETDATSGSSDDSAAPGADSAPSTNPVQPDGGADAGGPKDAAVDSSGTVTADSGTGVDSGLPIDSGSPIDSGVDSGSAVDSGSPIDSGSDTGTNHVDSGVDAGIDSSAPRDSGLDATFDATTDSGLDAAPDAPADTGTDTGADGGSPCPDNNGGAACTPTEQKFVNKSVACYQCLVMGECLDNVIIGDTNKECGDVSGNATAGAKAGTPYTTLCLALIDCIFANSCASSDVSICYCGDLGAGNACSGASSGANGKCLQQEVDGANHLVTDAPSVVFPALGDQTNGTGKANQIFVCANGNNCHDLCSAP